MTKNNSANSAKNSSSIISHLDSTFTTKELTLDQVETLISNRSSEEAVLIKSDFSAPAKENILTASLTGFLASESSRLVLPINHLKNNHLTGLMIEKKADDKIEVVYFDPIGFVNEFATNEPSNNQEARDNSSIPTHIVKAVTEGLKISESQIKFTEDRLQSCFYNKDDENSLYASSNADSRIITTEVLTNFAAGNLAFKNMPHFKLNSENSDIENVADENCSNLLKIAVKSGNETQLLPVFNEEDKINFARETIKLQLSDLVKIYQTTNSALISQLKPFETQTEEKDQELRTEEKTSSNYSKPFSFVSTLKSLLPFTIFSLASSQTIPVPNSKSPTFSPTAEPSENPTTFPTPAPTFTANPSLYPSFVPSLFPSVIPSLSPSAIPSISPSKSPSFRPSLAPSRSPIIAPSPLAPSNSTSTSQPSLSPVAQPSLNDLSTDQQQDFRSIIYSATVGIGSGLLVESLWNCITNGGSIGGALIQLYQENLLTTSALSTTFIGVSSAVGYAASFSDDKESNQRKLQELIDSKKISKEEIGLLNLFASLDTQDLESIKKLNSAIKLAENNTTTEPTPQPTQQPNSPTSEPSQQPVNSQSNENNNQNSESITFDEIFEKKGFFGKGYFNEKNYGPEGAVAGAAIATTFLASLMVFACCKEGCKKVIPSRAINPSGTHTRVAQDLELSNIYRSSTSI
jgi:hypothetical protein